MSDLEDSNNVVIIPRTGDIVIIINPKKGQEKLGIVTGHSVGGKVKILTKNIGIVNDIDVLFTHNFTR